MDEYVERKSDTKHEPSRELLRQCRDWELFCDIKIRVLLLAQLPSIAELQAEIEEYLVYYNQKRIKLDLKGLSPVQYRAQYLS